MTLLTARMVCRAVSLLLAIQSLTCGLQAEIPSEGQVLREQQGTRDDGMMMESYLEDQTSESGSFGASILQEFHLHSLECRINISRQEQKYQVKIGRFLQYYQDNKKAMAAKHFESLTNHTRKDVERNIKGTMHRLEREKINKLKQVAKTCQEGIQKWLKGKLVETVNRGKHTLRKRPSEFDGTLRAVRLFQSRLFSHKKACERPGGSEASTVTCDPRELQLLLNFTLRLISRMDYIRDIYYSDDEELGASSIGSGEDWNGLSSQSLFDLRETVRRVPSMEAARSFIPGQENLESKANSRDLASETHSTNTEYAIHSDGESVGDNSGLDKATPSNFTESLATQKLSSTTELIKKAETTDKEQESSGEDMSSHNSVGDIIIVEPKQPPQVQSHTSSGNRHQVLVALAVLVTVVLVTALAIVAVLTYLVVKKRQMHKSGYVRVQVTSETEATNDTLEEIKKAGYVNPTYKFYTRC